MVFGRQAFPFGKDPCSCTILVLGKVSGFLLAQFPNQKSPPEWWTPFPTCKPTKKMKINKGCPNHKPKHIILKSFTGHHGFKIQKQHPEKKYCGRSPTPQRNWADSKKNGCLPQKNPTPPKLNITPLTKKMFGKLMSRERSHIPPWDKEKKIFKSVLVGDMLVSRRVLSF